MENYYRVLGAPFKGLCRDHMSFHVWVVAIRVDAGNDRQALQVPP